MIEQIAVNAALGVTGEITKSNGFKELINSLIEITCGDILLLGSLKKQSKEAILFYNKKILFETDKIEDSNFQSPVGHEQQVILLSALEQSKNYISLEQYRNIFSKLISSTFDKSKYGFLHPSFPFIISQLTPLDCMILSDIKNKSKSYTMRMKYSYELNNETVSDEFFDYYLILNENDEYEDVELTNISINNLEKQNLIKLIPINAPEDVDHSFDSKKHNSLILKQSHPSGASNGGGAGGLGSQIILTRLGFAFLKTCI